jgi:hypothetical protein
MQNCARARLRRRIWFPRYHSEPIGMRLSEMSSVSATESSVPLGHSMLVSDWSLKVHLSVRTPVCLSFSTQSNYQLLIPIMQFFFLGESQSNPREIEVDKDGSLYDLQSLIAAHFAIVEPQGMPVL